MRRVFIVVYIIFAVAILANTAFYRNLYKKQIDHYFGLLDRQVHIVGLEVDDTDQNFLSDIHRITASAGLTSFFTDEAEYSGIVDKLKLFHTKYENLVNGIRFFDNQRNEFSLKKDSESKTEGWLEQPFRRHDQGDFRKTERLVYENGRHNYYIPVYGNGDNEIAGNLVVTIDYRKYFTDLFTKHMFRDFQWQWVIGDSGRIIYSNYADGKIPEYSHLDRISGRLAGGSTGNITHNVTSDGGQAEIISSYYSAELLQRDLGLVFSAPTDFFRKFIIRNSLFVILITLVLVQVIIFILWQYLKSVRKENEQLRTAESTLFRLIDEMPVGVVIHNPQRKILKTNKVAANLFSFRNESEMQGTFYPDPVFSGSGPVTIPGVEYSPEKFMTVGDTVLFRKSLPLSFSGQDSTMEILIDVTMLESARRQEAKANMAKSEFLARMSAEIRTPLNGIIGMAEVLNRYELNPEVREIVKLLHRSTDVLLNIVNDILDFSRIESGKIIINEMPFNLREEIGFCCDLARTSMPAKVTLNSEVDGNVPERIIGDPYRLRQVLTNLLIHSVNNTPKGEIRLSCDLRSRQEGQLVLGFELLDTGIKFDRITLKRIFGDKVEIDSRPFGMNDESLLGTVISSQLINLMGGSLTAVSPSGLDGNNGTRVDFTIPAYADERIIKKVASAELTSMNKIRTLVITGNSRDENTIGVLHELGLNITVTTFMRSTPGQIKMNLVDPGDRYSLIVIFDDEKFNGFEVAGSLWENQLSENFIIIMISSNDRRGNYLKCTRTGIDHYLVRPPEGELMKLIRKCFPAASEAADAAVPSGNGSRILIVEDNRMNQKVLSTMLSNMGYVYDIVEDGYEAFLKAKSTRYDFIFMDLMLPEMNGFEASQRILKHDKAVKIFAFTADNLPETRKKAELSGISDFVAKPVRIDELKKLFERHSRK
jgi:signal transduction histidine kinase/CheY-like chemotaxis protein/PAS domain-containing protein